MIKIRNNDLSLRSIDIDISKGVSVHLYKDEYDNLCNLLCADLKEQFEISSKQLAKANETRKQCFHLTKEIREIFYDCESGDIAIRKELNEIDQDKLFYDVFDRYSRLLGFE